MFIGLFSDDATVLDERQTHYTTEVFDTEEIGPDRFLVTGRLTGNFPGETAGLGWDFTISGAHISRLVIAPP